MVVIFKINTLNCKHRYLKKNEWVQIENKFDMAMEEMKYLRQIAFWGVFQRDLKITNLKRHSNGNMDQLELIVIDNSCSENQISVYCHLGIEIHRSSRSCFGEALVCIHRILYTFRYIICSNARCKLRIFWLL